MAVTIQTAQAPAKGGLNLAGNKQEMLKMPNLAEALVNFEAGINGGYKQIKGYEKVNLSAIPNTGPITGVLKYRDGLLVCRGDAIYYSYDYSTWYAVNKNETGLSLVDINLSVATLPRDPEGNYVIKRFIFGNTEKIVMTDGKGKACVLTITGPTPASYIVSFEEVDNDSVSNPKGNEVHLNQAYYFGNSEEPHVVYHSNLLDLVDLTGATAGFFAVKDGVEGIRLFNKELYVFTPTNISVVSGVDSGETSVQPFADDVGCLSGSSLQEVGGDIIFLAKDGIRTLKTAQASDTTEASTISHAINPLLVEFLRNIDQYTVTSTVIRDKNQYRINFTKNGSNVDSDHTGFIGVIQPDGTWSWSTYNSHNIINMHGRYFGDSFGDVFEIDKGNSFDGTDINSVWETPWVDLGNIGSRKNLRFIELDMILSSAATINLDVEFDYNKSDIHNPDRFEFPFTDVSSVYGTAVYGVDSYTALVPRYPKKYLEGSGHVVKFRFSSSTQVDEWTMFGFALSLTQGGNI